MPAMNTRLPDDTTPLKSGVFSGFFPPDQCTFFTGRAPLAVLPWARAARR